MDGPILVIDRDGTLPLGVQLVEGLRRGILGGVLRAGDHVPSTRALAAELGVSRSAVVTAYEQLAGEGYLEMRQGAPTRVAELTRRAEPSDRRAGGLGAAVRAAPAAPAASAAPTASGPQLGTARRLERAVSAGSTPLPHHPPIDVPGNPSIARVDLTPGRPSTARIDTRAWRAAWRHAAAQEIPAESPPPLGVPRLRAEIADHLRHARGVACSPDDVVVTAGTSDAVALVASALRDLVGGTPTIAVEHPGYPSARRILEHRGARTTPIAVDADGIVVASLKRMPRPPHAVMVTPSHQYPLGGRLPVAARLELLDWARSVDALIIEDDYDSEFRHLGPPLPALASLDGRGDAASGGAAGGAEAGGGEVSDIDADSGRVVLVGSFSKVLTPWLRLGYLVLPPNAALRHAITAIRGDEPCPVAGVAQEAVAALLASGAVRRHIAATRRDYSHRRRLVQEALGGLPGAPLTGLDGGLHAVVGLPDAATSAALVARLAAEGVAVARLADYSAVPGDEHGGIVFGYAGPSDTLLAEGLARIRAGILDLEGTQPIV